MDMYTQLIQYNVDAFIDLQSFRFLLKGDIKSGRTHCLIGAPQDPGLLLIFTGHVFYRLEELKKLEKNNTFENRFNYKMFLKCYLRENNQYFDVLTNCKEPMNDFESVISFDSQLAFLKLLRIILKNIDQRKFETAKEYHTYQQNQGSFRLGQVTFDFILEKTSTTWYGVQEIKCAHFKFETIDLQTPTVAYDQDRVIYFLNPALKYQNSTKTILRDSKFAKISKQTDKIDIQTIKNKFNFILRSIKIIKNRDILIQLQLLFKQFRKEIEKLNLILELKSDVIEQVQQQLRLDIQAIGKVITSVDVREFLLSKFLLYQVNESFDICLPFQKKIDLILAKIRKIKKQKFTLNADYNDNCLETRVFKDIKRNLQDILNFIKDEVYSEQHRAYNYQQIKNHIQEDFVQQLPDVQIEDLIQAEVTQQSSNSQLPTLEQKKHMRSKQNSLLIEKFKNGENVLSIDYTLKLIKQTARSHQGITTTRSHIPRLKTDKCSLQSSKKAQLKLIKIDTTPRGVTLQSPMFINLENQSTSLTSQKQKEFKQPEDYKKLNSVINNSSKILNTMSQLSNDQLQNSVMSSDEIIKGFQSKVKLKKYQSLYKMPNLSTNYLNCLERMVNLEIKSKQ
ncbi:unnamed protein product (macronuclear) [Paramecium tetraurelia]|uniref:Uncharacterized protein n=1 Tax=Paramecium tetraurelia TaxID=5888 RepID=A0BIF7_PARTE|nr:uncharacterized protein GSPATT00004696001 [Paramecium tetraurelia]CAK58324.1 unnamed protein product [Paramecium tetraurelia]|eukprot:XP_001425722.1 hypothetical protein (macronuclear) [Paramecium tetraurelia strain d4-2]